MEEQIKGLEGYINDLKSKRETIRYNHRKSIERMIKKFTLKLDILRALNECTTNKQKVNKWKTTEE